MSQQALQQDTTQHSTGQKSKARGGRTVVLSVTSFLIGLLDRGYPPWEPENPLQHQEMARCQSRLKETAQEEAGAGGRRKMEGEKRNQFPWVETALPLTVSVFETKIRPFTERENGCRFILPASPP